MTTLETNDERRRRLAENERYNRRTRAIERNAAAQEAQAEALDRIASAIQVQALATALGTPTRQVTGERVWKDSFATEQQERLSAWVKGLRR